MNHTPRSTATLVVAALLLALVVASPAAGASWTCRAGYVALTFDDGPDRSAAQNTQQIVSILGNFGVHATFFQVGENVAALPAATQTVVAAGHVVGNHSYTHPYLTNLSGAQVTAQLGDTNAAIVTAGGPAPTLFRPPYGSTNDSIRATAEGMGMTETLWNVDPRDYNAKNSSAIVKAVTRKLRGGDIVLLHDGGTKYTVGALPSILTSMQSKGLCPGLIERSAAWDWGLRGYTRVVPDPNGPHA